MKSLPKISFVIPVYNRAHMILDALESLKEQTIPEWEAIVVDDHSTDNLEEVVKGFNDPRVTYVKLPDNRGKGVACARNYGNLLAKAELIAVLDSDDLAKPERAERAIKSYEEHKWDFYCTWRHTFNMADGSMTLQKIQPLEWDTELFKKASYVTHSSVVYTRKAALEIPYNSALPALDDYDLITRFIVLDKKMHLESTITAVWRRHMGETLTSRFNEKERQKLLHGIRTWRGWE